ncbi:-glutamine gamma-glutamyltransferase E-like [Pelobates cultripes]|uniref:protein-glutamine gamma-glutamyltransferase n=1 Tax=Pelobates cultripes TaxID=61616 RepID=A0AAD1SNW7_PELCU|nr:-glutamine gamma-glutamyltransferase E-like [Pelobates cultripes]
MTSLRLINWDLRPTANATAHRTKDFFSNKLILRRGQSAQISIGLSRSLSSGDSLTFISEIGPSPSESQNTRNVMPLSQSGSRTAWSATSSSTGSTLTVAINIPANTIVGHYTMRLEMKSGGRSFTQSLGEFYVLFNAWASDDEVFMTNEAERVEYVLNETGLVFIGNWNNQSSRQWDYGQFEDGILDITLAILDKSLNAGRNQLEDLSQRNSAMYICRVLSAMVNSNNDRGIVIGNWSGNYSNGVSPSRWNGSVPILRSWSQNGPVAYGQCWVFAGVLCTVLRCLGIPTRVITNFESAHDTDVNLFVDRYFDQNGNPTGDTTDSIWNFHVWNESFCIRSDLGSMYNGWQIVDATPQEPSQGEYRLGPCALKAIKEGDVDLLYDTPFVFTEVNGDSVDWLVYNNGTKKKVSTNSRSIGRFISTKAIGAFRRVDVTNDYKYSEGTAKEREIFEKAQRKLSGPALRVASRSAASGRMAAFASNAAVSERMEAPAPKPDYVGSFSLKEQTQVGEDLAVTITLKNTGPQPKVIKVDITATAIIYTRAPVKEIQREEQSLSLQPNEEKKIQFTITYSQYSSAITSDNMILLVAVCEDDKGGNLIIDTVAVLKNPPLLIKISSNPIQNKPLKVTIIFSNPIGEVVTDSILAIEGSGLLKNLISFPVSTLKPNQRSITELEIIPYRPGRRCLLVNFSSNAFSDVKAFSDFTVAPA